MVYHSHEFLNYVFCLPILQECSATIRGNKAAMNLRFSPKYSYSLSVKSLSHSPVSIAVRLESLDIKDNQDVTLIIRVGYLHGLI